MFELGILTGEMIPHSPCSTHCLISVSLQMIASLVIGSIPEEIRSVADANTRARGRDVFPGAVDYATPLIALLGWMG